MTPTITTTPQLHCVGTEGRYHFILIVNGNPIRTEPPKEKR